MFGGSNVREIDGEEAENEILKDKYKSPKLVMAYHPQCAHCEKLIKPYKKLATQAKKHKAGFEIIAINMSKTPYNKQLATGYPTVQLFKGPG